MHRLDVQFRDLPARRVGYLRAVGPFGQMFKTLWPRFGAFAGPAGLLTDNVVLGVMHDDPGITPADACRGDAAAELKAGMESVPGLDVQTLPGGRHAIATHRGSFSGLGATWGAFTVEWRRTSGETVRPGPWYEIYVTDPSKTPEVELVTELCMPVA